MNTASYKRPLFQQLQLFRVPDRGATFDGTSISSSEFHNQIIDEQAQAAATETEVRFQGSFCLGTRLVMEVVQHDLGSCH